ncbi:glycosyltransferase family 39 protein [Paenibacillus sp. YIM B09110]|uniref:glycosyltransferase family 39 protein n=1 Tax=Paenibacillus sp. YIM B09110 TaxID=3126102 RepID=UPI00301CACBE
MLTKWRPFTSCHALVLIVSFVVIISTYITFSQGHDMYLGSFTEYNNDDVKYIRSAETLLQHGIFTYHEPDVSTVFIMPGLPFVLAFCMKLFGYWGGIQAFRLVQILFLAGTIVLLYLFSRRLLNDRFGIIVALLFALYIPNYVAANLILTEVLGQFFLWLFLYAGYLAVTRHSLPLFALAAASLSLGIYERPNFALLPVVFLVYMLIHGYRVKQLIKPALVVSGVVLLCMSPWWIRNAIVFHEFIPLTLSSGNPSLLGSQLEWQYPPGAVEKFKDDFDKIASATNRIDSDRFQKELAVKIRNYGFQTQPMAYLWQYTADRVNDMFKVPYYWKEIFGLKPHFVKTTHFVMIGIGILGFIMTLVMKVRRKDLSLLWLTALYFVVTALPFITFSRYGYFLMSFFIIYAAFAIHAFIPKAQLHSSRAKSSSSLHG